MPQLRREHGLQLTHGAPRTPLWLLPGLDGTGRLYEPLVPFLLPSFGVRVVDYPHDLGRYDELLLAIERPPPGTIVVGESFGGPLAIRLAARDPDRVAAVVLVASFVTAPVRVPGAALLTRLVHPPPELAIRIAMLDARSPPGIAALLRDAVRGVPAATISARVVAAGSVDARAELASLRCEVTWIVARGDRLVPRRATRIASATRSGLRVVEVDGPHLLAQARPDRVADVIAEVAARAGLAT